MPRPLIIAISGASGFLGPYVIAAAASRGHALRLLVRTPSKLPDDLGDNVSVFKGSLSDIPEGFTQGADVVLHMAGLIKAPSKAAFFEVNGAGTERLAAQAQSDGVAHFVYLSSQAASQPQLSGYGASKRAGETALNEVYHGEISIIRAPAVFGPGDQATAPFFAFMKRGLLPVPGGKGWAARKLSLIYAPDLARFIVDKIESRKTEQQPITPSSVGSITWPEFAQAASEVIGHRVKPLPLPIFILKLVAGVNSMLRRIFNPHLTLGKLSEFLYEDWSADIVIDTPTAFKTALRETMQGKT